MKKTTLRQVAFKLAFVAFALLAPLGLRAQTTLTVHDETTTNNVIPAYIYYFDDYTRSQFVVPADELAEMSGGTISAIKFYTTSSNVPYTTVSTVDVYLMEVGYTTMTALEPKANGTIVYQGTLAVVTDGDGGSLTITLSTPYTYGGGNLLVGIENTTDAAYKNIYFYGESVTGASWGGSHGSSLSSVTGTQRNFIPKTTFTYTPGATDCDMPTAIAITDGSITPNGAEVTWQGDGNTWNLRYKKSTETDYTMVNGLTDLTYGLTGLDENTTYSVGVQTVCSGNTSNFRSTSFTTANPCAVPTNLQISDITSDEATLSWTPGYQETEWIVKYKPSTETDWNNAIVETVNEPTITLSSLASLTTYNVQVFNCENYVSANFTTAAGFPYSQDFTASGIPTGWNQYSGLLDEVMAGSATLSSITYGWDNGTSNGVLDGNNIYANIYGSSCKRWIVSPGIPMPSGARLTFDVAYTAYSGTAIAPAQNGDDDKFVVLASTDNMATWTILRQWDNAGSEYVLNDLTPSTLSLSFDMAAYAGATVNIAFYAESTVSNADNNIHVDNVVFELIPSCEKPTNLSVNYTNGVEATVTWEGTATSYNIDVNGTVTEGVTSPYTLSGLVLATTYEVKVQADCGANGTSEWTNPVSFTTDPCMPENQCELTFALTDSYGDGWNGAYIDVVDVATNTSLAHMTNQNLNGIQGTGTNELNTLTLAVCDGRELQFVWHSGSYDSECSYVVTDVNGEEIFSGSGAMSAAVNHTVSCAVTGCRKPTDLAASEIGPHSAVLSWTENGEATEWVVAYTTDGIAFTEDNATTNPYTLTGLDDETMYGVKVRPACEDNVEKWSDMITFTTEVACPKPTNLAVTPAVTSAEVSWTGFAESYDLQWALPPAYTPSDNAAWLQYDNNTFSSGIGSGTAATWTWGVMYPSTMLSDNTYLTKVGVFETAAYYTMENYTVNIYTGGDDAPGTLVGTETVVPAGADGMHEITLTSPVAIDPAQNLWITVTAYGTYVMSNCEVDPAELNNQWVNNGGTWAHIGDLNSSLAVKSWMIRGLIDENSTPTTWTDVTGVTSPYTLTGLDAETSYKVRVKANCGTDGESNWTAIVPFTTHAICEVPSGLTADNLTASTATLDWTGYQESYNVRYRMQSGVEGFDYSSMNGWTTIDADGDGYTWVLGSAMGGVYLADGGSLAGTGHNSSNDMVGSGSYSNFSGGALTPDNYLVSPQITLGGTISFYAATQDASYAAEHFGVAVSTTGNTDAADFTTIAEWTMTAAGTPEGAKTQGSWGYYTVDLSAYSGQGYVAIRHFDCTDMFILLIDDIEITQPGAGEQAWTTLNNQTNPVNVTGLTPETTYEFQVQGVNSTCTGGLTEWSTMGNFTTGVLSMDIDANKWYAISTPVHNNGVNETLAGVTNLIPAGTEFAYDLYGYNESEGKWVKPATVLEQGMGYIYRRSTDATLTFNGTKNTGDVSVSITATDAAAELKGFNLVGNPYLHAISYADHYTLNTNGTWQANTNGTIGVAEGFLIHETSDNTINFTENTSKSAPVAMSNLAFTVRNGEFEDVAYARFENGDGLPKIGHIAPNAPALSIPVDGRRYAIANLGYDCESFDMNFRGTEGQYTLTFNSQLSTLNYCHLIDRANGKDIDLLSQPTYTFTQTAGSVAERFLVKLVPGIDDNAGFVHWNGSAWVVEGNGTLQVFDVLGRRILTKDVNAQLSISTSQFPGTGVYILRLGEKSQKIVVK